MRLSILTNARTPSARRDLPPAALRCELPTNRVTQEAPLDPDRLIAELEATGDYRVLRRFAPRPSYGSAPAEEVRHGLVVDVETTGLDHAADAIIEFAAVPFSFSSAAGTVTGVADPVSWLEDPGRPIPREVVELTGITTEMVAGKRIDEAAIQDLAGAADLVIAHNAGFDRKFLNRRFPLFREKHWACSQREVPWRREVGTSAALEYLMMKSCGMFFQGHRAGVDCQALVHLLATPFPSGNLPMKLLLESARRATARVWAVDAPFEVKDLLKSRGYSWSGGGEGRPRAWYREIPRDDLEAEKAWLSANAYGGRPASPRVDLLTARTRYSD